MSSMRQCAYTCFGVSKSDAARTDRQIQIGREIDIVGGLVHHRHREEEYLQIKVIITIRIPGLYIIHKGEHCLF